MVVSKYENNRDNKSEIKLCVCNEAPKRELMQRPSSSNFRPSLGGHKTGTGDFPLYVRQTVHDWNVLRGFSWVQRTLHAWELKGRCMRVHVLELHGKNKKCWKCCGFSFSQRVFLWLVFDQSTVKLPIVVVAKQVVFLKTRQTKGSKAPQQDSSCFLSCCVEIRDVFWQNPKKHNTSCFFVVFWMSYRK